MPFNNICFSNLTTLPSPALGKWPVHMAYKHWLCCSDYYNLNSTVNFLTRQVLLEDHGSVTFRPLWKLGPDQRNTQQTSWGFKGKWYLQKVHTLDFENIQDWLVNSSATGCSLSIGFSPRFKNIPDSGFLCFPLCVRVCTHTRQVENQRCSTTGRVQKNHRILRKKHNF